MQLFFDHVIIQNDFHYTLVAAHFETEEEDEALNSGWIPISSWYDDDTNFSRDASSGGPTIWVQTRSARICIHDFVPSKSQRRVSRKANAVRAELVRDVERIDFQYLYSIYLAYMARRGFADPMPADEFVLKHRGDRFAYVLYYHGDAVVAFSIIQLFERALYSHRFCWNYEFPKLGLGIFSMLAEIEIASELDCSYVYVGGIAGDEGRYKAGFGGFQYWTGRMWREPDELLDKWLRRDNEVCSINDLNSATNEFIVDHNL